MRRLQFIRHCVSSPDSSLSDKSFQPLALRTSSPSLPRHLCHHHSLVHAFFFSSQYICPYHFKLLSWTFLDISPTFAIPLILSFLILSSLVTPPIHREARWLSGRMPDSQSREPGFESPLIPFRSLGIFFHFTTPQSTQLYK